MQTGDIASAAIRTLVEWAEADGVALSEVADWTNHRVAHMVGPLSPALKARIDAAYPGLEWFEDKGSPHDAPSRGYIDGGSAISFPVVP